MEEEIGQIDGVRDSGSWFGGTGIEIEADRLEDLPEVISRVSLAVLGIIQKYDAFPDRMPPQEE